MNTLDKFQPNLAMVLGMNVKFILTSRSLFDTIFPILLRLDTLLIPLGRAGDWSSPELTEPETETSPQVQQTEDDLCNLPG